MVRKNSEIIGACDNGNMHGKLKTTEALLAKKILLLRQKYKQQKKEERVLMIRNKKLVNEFQSHKETLKGLNDERLALQKEVYDKKCAKAVSEGNNIALKNSLSSFLNDLHALQTKVINSWRENQRDSLVGKRNSSKKPVGSSLQESLEERTISEVEPDRRSRASPSPQDDFSQQDDVLVCKVEALNTHEPVLTSLCDPPECKQELSILLSSFCRRDTVPLNNTSGVDCLEPENVPLERTCESDCQETANLPLVKTDFQNFENAPLQRTTELDFQNFDNVPQEKSCEPHFEQSANVTLVNTSEPDCQESGNVLLEKNKEPDYQQSVNEGERNRLPEEPFHGFVEDQNEKARFREMITRLSVKCENLDSLRNYEIAQSLAVYESNPEITEKEAATTSTLEVDLSKQYKIQQLEVSIPRLDLSAYPSLNSTIEILKKDVSRGRKSLRSNHSEEESHRETTPDSASESSSKGRSLRRARNPVSYKEQSIKRKLRRN